MRALAAVHLPIDHALGILYGNAAFAHIHEGDQHDDDQGSDHDDQQLPDGGAIAGDAQHIGQAQHDGVKQVGDDTGKDQQADAVADAVGGDALTDPHGQGSTAGHDHADGQVTKEVVILGIKHVAAALQTGDDTDRLQSRQDNRHITGDAVDLLLALVAAFLAQAFQRRNGDSQQLHNNAGVDVGGNAHGHDGHLAEGVTCHHVNQSQHVVLAGNLLHYGSVDAGNRDHAHQTEQQQHQEGINQLFAKLFDLPCVTQRFPHVRSPRLSRRRLRSFLSRTG